ncbi:MAG: multidrug effflux MFS transporter [Burkholderiales bacterium]|nr:multidrug effflux MFS transporter [Burkholderiales bacterium]
MSTSLLTLLLALITMVGPLGIDTYLPSFHAIGADFGVSQLVVQQTLSLYVGGMAVMMLFYGTLADSFGRRRVMLVSLVAFVLTSLAAVFAASAGQLVLVRALQGLAGGAGMVIARAMVTDRYQGGEAQRMLALILMVFGVAPAIAPVIGGWLQATWGWRSVFVFLTVFGALLLAASWRVLPETLPVAARQPFRLGVIVRNYVAVLSRGRFMLMSLAFGLVFCGLPLYVGSAAAYVMGILGQPETAFGWLFLPLVGGLVSGSALASRLARRLPPARMIRLGFAVMVAAVGWSVAYTFFFKAAVPWAVLPFGLYTFGLSLASPGMTVMAMDEFPELRGLAASMQSFVQMLAFSLITGLVAPLLFGSALWLALGHVAGVLLGMAVWWMGTRGRGAGGAPKIAD